jgi:carboxyl-terminal processing protease
MTFFLNYSRHWLPVILLAFLLSCSSGEELIAPPTEEELTWSSGVFLDSEKFQNFCQDPRTGSDRNGDSFPDRDGSTLHENHFLRAWSDNTYLWYSEIEDTDPALTDSTAAYFDLLKTAATTASGNPKDKFHFTYASDEWLQLTQAGISAGYGLKWTIVSASPPREVRVAYTELSGPANTANIMRGAEVLEIDGIDFVNDSDQASVDIINAALFPSNADEVHSFVIRDIGSSETRTVSLTSAEITATPVLNVSTLDTSSGKVGYLLFNAHIQTAEEGLMNAISELSDANVTDLILDLRYNGGGLLAIASQLAYMVAGSENTSGKTFENIVFNDKHTSTNPITGRSLSPTPFYDESLGFSVSEGQSLPSLNLNRVFVLSTARTCSASEAVINGLRGVGVEVILIGSTTCGKPYGFYAQDNCGTTYFTIQFQGINDMGFGDYSDGFSPANTSGTVGEVITGCSVADDFTNPLGNEQESQMAAALSYRDSGTCPETTGKSIARFKSQQALQEGSLFNSDIYKRYLLLRENGIINSGR